MNKIAKVLGEERARQLMDRILGELRLELRTSEDLLRLSEAMTGLGGFESAVGGMLGVAAVLRGAGAPRERRTPTASLDRAAR